MRAALLGCTILRFAALSIADTKVTAAAFAASLLSLDESTLTFFTRVFSVLLTLRFLAVWTAMRLVFFLLAFKLAIISLNCRKLCREFSHFRFYQSSFFWPKFDNWLYKPEFPDINETFMK